LRRPLAAAIGLAAALTVDRVRDAGDARV